MTKVLGDLSGQAVVITSEGLDVAWTRFLLEEGLEALAAYRSIADRSVRERFTRLMKEAARAECQVKPQLN